MGAILPKISVIMPVFNGEKYLKDAVQSILSQDFIDFELLILNDGSTDNSLKIAKTYTCDPRVTVFELNRVGLVSALNIGLEKAKGEFIARMDADDISLPNRFSVQLSYFENNSMLGVLGCGNYLVNENLVFSGFGFYPHDKKFGINDRLKKGNFLCHPGVMFKKSLIKDLGPYSKFFHFAEDYELWARYSLHTLIDNTVEKLLIYRQHDSNISFINYPHQAMTAEIISFMYTKNKHIENIDGDFVNFEHLKNITTKIEFREIIKKWSQDVRGMISTGRLNDNLINKYFKVYLNDNQ